MKRILITGFLIILVISVATLGAIFYAKGYRIIPKNGKTTIEGTGLLVLTSKPDGARVFVNNRLNTATDNTINLQPGEYDIRIEKDGYFNWKKNISIKKEQVSRADAILFPIAPILESISTTGASNLVLDPSGTLVAYTVLSPNLEKNGVYLLDMNNRPLLPFAGKVTQITNNLTIDFSKSRLTFSPDGSRVIASVSGSIQNHFLLNTRGFNSNPESITSRLTTIQQEWEQEALDEQKKVTNALPKKIKPIFGANFKNPIFAPDKDKILYEASRSAEIPMIISPRLPGINSTPEQRKIKEGDIYVYDIKEDKNYLLFSQMGDTSSEQTPYFAWHPSSRNLIYIKEKKIQIVEYDGENNTVIYAAPFFDDIVYPWPDGSGILILTNLNLPNTPYNLYKVVLK